MAEVPLAFVVVDAFTKKPFGGNPACIVVECPEWQLNETAYQLFAREMNLSETAYLKKMDENKYGIRWWTPNGEVDLCGHATIASAHALFESGVITGDTIEFSSKSGTLFANRNNETGGIQLDFPEENPTQTVPEKDVEIIEKSLGDGVKIVNTIANRLDVLVHIDGGKDAILGLNPDTTQLALVDTRCVIVTSRSTDSDYDVYSRVFAPRFGIAEDPVTGSAHCGIGPYWKKLLGGKGVISARQASARGGDLILRLDTPSRVKLEGFAVSVTKGSLLIPASQISM